MDDDSVLEQVQLGIQLRYRGDPEAAREHFLGLWEDVGTAGDPLSRCAIAHQLADLQDDPADELAWDLLALAAADTVTEPLPSSVPLAQLYPSLHLNLGESYRKLGRPADARAHLARAEEAANAFEDESVRDAFRQLVDGSRKKLAESDADNC